MEAPIVLHWLGWHRNGGLLAANENQMLDLAIL